jgi:hypothetical protein
MESPRRKEEVKHQDTKDTKRPALVASTLCVRNRRTLKAFYTEGSKMLQPRAGMTALDPWCPLSLGVSTFLERGGAIQLE